MKYRRFFNRRIINGKIKNETLISEEKYSAYLIIN